MKTKYSIQVEEHILIDEKPSSNDDYYIRVCDEYDQCKHRSNYSNYAEAIKEYNKTEVNKEHRYIELWCEPLEDEEAQYLMRYKEVSKDQEKVWKVVEELFG